MTAPPADTAYHRSNVFFTRQDMADLRELAARLGHMQTTGSGAGRDGSVSALLRALADAYRRDPDGLAGVLKARQGRGA